MLPAHRLDPGAVVLRRAGAVADRDRPALRVVRRRQLVATPAAEQGVEHPAQVTDVAQAGVEPVPPGRRGCVRGVAGQQDPPRGEALGGELAAAPGHHPPHVPRAAVVPHGPPHDGVEVEALGRETLFRADQAEPPQLAPVDRRQVGPGSLGADEHVPFGPAEGVIVLQVVDLPDQPGLFVR